MGNSRKCAGIRSGCLRGFRGLSGKSQGFPRDSPWIIRVRNSVANNSGYFVRLVGGDKTKCKNILEKGMRE